MPAPRRLRLVALGLAFSTAVTALAGCDGNPANDRGAQPAGDGPLSVAGGEGGHIALPAKTGGRPAKAVYGGLLLCTREGVAATITGVSFDSAVESAEVTDVVRAIPDAAEREDPDSDRWAPIIALRGNVLGPRLRARLGGQIHDRAEGFVVDLPCGERRPGEALAELMTSISADAEGGDVRSQTITYEAAGRSYTVEVPWRFVLCGSAVDDEDCDRMGPID